ncbi:MAG: hypothetical protein M3P06_22490 [Acidobacteriota bacterium]|nr:hypothetical protein [Acidobacteriota bacterium]
MTLPLLLLVAGHASAETLTVAARPHWFVRPAALEKPATATLRLIPESTLPGIPVSFLITITNPNDQVLRIGDGMNLKVTTDVDTFDVLDLLKHDTFRLPSEGVDDCGGASCLYVPAHGKRELLVDVGSMLVGNAMLLDHRLMKPGVYDLELTLYDHDRWFDRVSIRTNVATLTVREPAGVDLEVWKLMNKAVDPYEWDGLSWPLWSSLLPQEIQKRYPTSAYLPSVVSMGWIEQFPRDLSALDYALAMNPPATVRDNILWTKACYLAWHSRKLLSDARDVEQVVALADRAREVFRELQRVAISDVMRKRAAQGLSRLYTRATALQEIEFREHFESPTVFVNVIPRVECVTRRSGTSFTARFGYENPSSAITWRQHIGVNNRFTPAPDDQGQPDKFEPGSHSNAFTASSPGGNLTWHLDGQKAVAKRDFAVQCGATAP